MSNKPMDGMNAADILDSGAATYRQRNEVYGDTYKNFGKVWLQMFPHGFRIRNSHDANRMGVMVQIVGKLVRYAANVNDGGHDDSLLDLSVYAAMLLELDLEGSGGGDKETPGFVDMAEKVMGDMKREMRIPDELIVSHSDGRV